jgi:hypothetical protein
MIVPMEYAPYPVVEDADNVNQEKHEDIARHVEIIVLADFVVAKKN